MGGGTESGTITVTNSNLEAQSNHTFVKKRNGIVQFRFQCIIQNAFTPAATDVIAKLPWKAAHNGWMFCEGGTMDRANGDNKKLTGYVRGGTGEICAGVAPYEGFTANRLLYYYGTYIAEE